MVCTLLMPDRQRTSSAAKTFPGRSSARAAKLLDADATETFCTPERHTLSKSLFPRMHMRLSWDLEGTSCCRFELDCHPFARVAFHANKAALEAI